MKKLFGLSALLVACVCIQQGAQAQEAKETNQVKIAQGQEVAPDNTGKNKRDKDNNTMTADKAGNSKSDVEIERDVRKQIMATKGLSINAQNVKIIAKHGVVTLRGPVKDENEKNIIEGIVKGCSCVQSFTDKLEVKGQSSQKP